MVVVVVVVPVAMAGCSSALDAGKDRPCKKALKRRYFANEEGGASSSSRSAAAHLAATARQLEAAVTTHTPAPPFQTAAAGRGKQ